MTDRSAADEHELATPGPVRRSSWGAAGALVIASLVLAVADPFTLVALPLALLFLAFPYRPWSPLIGSIVLIWGLIFVPAGAAGSTARGWALVLGGSLVIVGLLAREWGAFSRALAAVALAFLLTAAGLAVMGAWGAVDSAMSARFQWMAPVLAAELDQRFPETAWAADLGAGLERMMEIWALLFPGMLALQSLAAIALVLWAFGRASGGLRWNVAPPLQPLREFRFHDSLVWVLVVGLILVALPMGDGIARIGYNLILVMGVLYGIRGFGVFAFLGRGGLSVPAVVVGTLIVVLFLQPILAVAVIVGLGDTWLDVRARAAASRA